MRQHKFSTKKVGNREARRRAQAAIEQGTKAFLICLAVLAQKGGEVIVTQGTLDQVMPKLDVLDFDIKPNKDIPGEFVVRLVDNSPKVTITKVGDDDVLDEPINVGDTSDAEKEAPATQ